MKYLVLVLLAGLKTYAQRQPKPDFDDLARRAAAASEDRPSEAAALYRQAVSLRPSWAEGWFYLGAAEYQLGQFPDALQAFRRAVELAPDNGAATAFLGLTESELGQDKQAITDILKAERLGLPDNAGFISRVRISAARTLLRASDFTAAVEQLRPLAMSGNESPAAIETLGIAALTMPLPSNRVPSAKRPLVTLAGRAAWSLYAQTWNEAEPLFQQLGQEYPDEPGVHYLRGIYYIDRDINTALGEFAAELKVTPTHVMARVQSAILLLRSGASAAALDPAREAVRLAPADLLARLTLGRALYDLGQTPEAIREFQAAAKLNPEYPHTHFYLAQAYRRAGREDDARQEETEFTRLKAAGSPTAGAGLPQK